jgi:hypothetical protein
MTNVKPLEEKQAANFIAPLFLFIFHCAFSSEPFTLALHLYAVAMQ